MKRLAMCLFACSLVVLFSCNQRDRYNDRADNDRATKDRTAKDDSKDIAEDQNDDKFDNKMEKDADFAVKAAEDGMLEVRVAQIAATNASSSEVKNFAKSIIADHNKVNEELRSLATSKNISLPASLGDRCQRKYDKIASKSGREFDKDFADLMVKDHKDLVDSYKKEAEKGNDADIKSFASRNISRLEHHLAMAQDLEDMVDRTNRASNDR
jgi:putative membrane protein